jgi:hypothetical protein
MNDKGDSEPMKNLKPHPSLSSSRGSILRLCSLLVPLCFCVFLMSCAGSGSANMHVGAEPAPDPLSGDWQGHLISVDGKPILIDAKMIAGTGGKYVANVSADLGEGMRFNDKLQVFLNQGGLSFTDANVGTCQGQLLDDEVTGVVHGKVDGTFILRHVNHFSPTLGARPPQGAIVLFDGTSLAAWRSAEKPAADAGWTLRDGIMEVKPGAGSIVTRKGLTDYNMHIEFRTPFMPEAGGQARGNSGVYMQGRYEIQVLDSYGLKGEDNECGGIYKVAAPAVNMCAPPGQWQTYDIQFKAPRFDAGGKKLEDAELSVLHNGVTIHNGLRIPGPTGGSLDQEVNTPGGIMLQDHGNLVQYRNIWLVERKENQ